VVPCTLTKNVTKKDFFLLLEAQRVEHLLIDTISSNAVPNISNIYYSEVLMAQRLRRAELEVELCSHAIASDGLHLLDSVYDFHFHLKDAYK